MPSVHGVGYILKRLLDLMISIPVLIILSPLMLVVALLVKFKIGSPVIFKQDRPGMNGRIFTLYKFKTLLDLYDENGNLLPDKDRLTPFGDFLRSFSIDELPQFINVVKGEMSAIGPRPQMEKYWELLSDEQKKVFNIKPGITGWAQINGRNTLTWEKRFELDSWYLENWSIWLDVKIAFITIWKILIREGIKHPGCATMVEFTGSRKAKYYEQWKFRSDDSVTGAEFVSPVLKKSNDAKIGVSDYN
ncbi:MAG TPA: sugar transferase [Desulfomonilia bacterium]